MSSPWVYMSYLFAAQACKSTLSPSACPSCATFPSAGITRQYKCRDTCSHDSDMWLKNVIACQSLTTAVLSASSPALCLPPTTTRFFQCRSANDWKQMTSLSNVIVYRLCDWLSRRHWSTCLFFRFFCLSAAACINSIVASALINSVICAKSLKRIRLRRVEKKTGETGKERRRIWTADSLTKRGQGPLPATSSESSHPSSHMWYLLLEDACTQWSTGWPSLCKKHMGRTRMVAEALVPTHTALRAAGDTHLLKEKSCRHTE